jgi:hypothetical protein
VTLPDCSSLSAVLLARTGWSLLSELVISLPWVRSLEIARFFGGGPIAQICYYEYACTDATINIPSLYELSAVDIGCGGGLSRLHAATSISIQLPDIPA